MQFTTIGLDIAKVLPGDSVFQSLGAMPGWHGSLCHLTLLGA